MENNATNFDRIEAYLFGQMSAEATAAFEQEISQNTDLALEVEQQRLEHRAMELMLREELRANLQSWKAEESAGDLTMTGPSGSKTVSINTTRRLVFRLAAAASVALVLGFFARQFFGNGLSNESLAMAEFESSGVNMRGSGTDALSPVYQAMGRKDYATALQQLNQLAPDFQPATVLNLRGECYFRLHQYAQAIATYEQLVQSKPADGDLYEKAEWHLVLSYVAKDGNSVEVQQRLDKVIGEGGQFAEAAEKLKKKMK